MISTMDSESTSRSSVNDLSSWTSSVGTPATSLTISARSVRTSSVVGNAVLLNVGVFGQRGCVPSSWQHDYLSGVDQTGAEADDQTGVARFGLSGLQQCFHG